MFFRGKRGKVSAGDYHHESSTSLQYDRLLHNCQHSTWYLLHRHSFSPRSILQDVPPVSGLSGHPKITVKSRSKSF